MSRVTCHGFTLIELLVVLSIMGILAALTVPAIKNFGRAEAQVAATRQLVDDVHRARALAMSQRTTVYMVFLPTNFWNLPGYSSLTVTQRDIGAKLYDKQLNSYAFVSLRSVGDQPGDTSPRYLSTWHSLPEGAFIPPWKFVGPNAFTRIPAGPSASGTPRNPFDVHGFSYTNNIPFPTDDAKAPIYLPYIAFNSLGQLVSQQDEYIPLARGTLAHALARDTKVPLANPPSVQEKPPGNSTNSFTLVHIDWLTGRAKVERQEIQ